MRKRISLFRKNRVSLSLSLDEPGECLGKRNLSFSIPLMTPKVFNKLIGFPSVVMSVEILKKKMTETLYFFRQKKILPKRVKREKRKFNISLITRRFYSKIRDEWFYQK